MRSTLYTAAAIAALGLVVAAAGPVAAQEPTADFRVDPDPPIAGESTTFTSTSSGGYGDIVGWEWRVDGEVVGESDTLRYTFEQAGDHEVMLRVRDEEYQTDTEERVVAVEQPNEPPTARLTVSLSDPTVGETVTFDASESSDPGSGHVVRYGFDVDGDGETDVGPDLQSSVDHSYDAPGNYTVSVTVYDDDLAKDSASTTVTVDESREHPAPDSWAPSLEDIVSDLGTVRAGESVWLNASDDEVRPNATYEWRIDGEHVGTGALLQHSFDDPGRYRIRLQLTTPGGNATRTATVGVAPANGSVNATMLAALDKDDDGRIDDTEVLEAVELWHDSAPVPGTANATLDDTAVLHVIEAWRTEASVGG